MARGPIVEGSTTGKLSLYIFIVEQKHRHEGWHSDLCFKDILEVKPHSTSLRSLPTISHANSIDLLLVHCPLPPHCVPRPSRSSELLSSPPTGKKATPVTLSLHIFPKKPSSSTSSIKSTFQPPLRSLTF
ncbi:hypothetical protein CLIB1423_31S00584 [[Candida] railenensis]|uniref:Uncharacterized protein n=1 Tax=[Candida] railenensis TaxID=45579 RepID=A0A9P0W1H4_9ASCO|nr:hypothetical protein CLIB1423_31S00584 [[Candida] railenensis]